MSVAVQTSPQVAERPRVVNDFNINVATVNGSGSQTSNSLLIRSLFKMGIPVTSKNLFPSNIQGLPTWYNIRLSSEGFLARHEAVEVVNLHERRDGGRGHGIGGRGRHHHLR